MIPRGLRYTETHEWIRENDDGSYTVGITAYAAEQLGDVVYVELPERDREVSQGDEVGSVESIKAVSDIYAPVGGRVSDVNDALEEHPELVNQSPYEKGWFFTLEDVDADEVESLLKPKAYEAFLAESEE